MQARAGVLKDGGEGAEADALAAQLVELAKRRHNDSYSSL